MNWFSTVRTVAGTVTRTNAISAISAMIATMKGKMALLTIKGIIMVMRIFLGTVVAVALLTYILIVLCQEWSAHDETK